MVKQTINTDFQKTPPQDLEIESNVLGCLMLESISRLRVIDLLKPEVFYKEAHRIIYTAIIELPSVDVLQVVHYLRKHDLLEAVGGAFYLSEMTNGVGSSVNLEQWCMILYELYMRRVLIMEAENISQAAYDDTADIFDTVTSSRKNLTSVLEVGDSSVDAKRGIIEVYEAMNNPEMLYIKSRYSELNERIKGYGKGEMIVIAGRPGHGKTSLMTCEALEMARFYEVVIFSFDMMRQQMFYRFLGDLTEIEPWKIDRKKLEAEELNKIHSAAGQIEKRCLRIYDKGMTIDQVELTIEKLKQQKKCDIVFIDYLQIMKRAKSKDLYHAMTDISNSVKRIAKDYEIPMIVLSQLSREVDKRKDRTPILSDLRDSGAIEQDADKVIFVYRPEVYDDLLVEMNNEGLEVEGKAKLIVAKNRQGPLGELKFNYNKSLMKFIGSGYPQINYDYTEKDSTDSSELPF